MPEQFFGFGGMAPQEQPPVDINPNATPEQKQQYTSQWTEIFSRPDVQSMLIQMGTQLMQPMSPYQTPMGAFGQALGAGGEAAGRVQARDAEIEAEEAQRRQRDRALDIQERRAAQTGQGWSEPFRTEDGRLMQVGPKGQLRQVHGPSREEGEADLSGIQHSTLLEPEFDYSQAYGTGGWLGQGVNTVVGAADQQAMFPETEKAVQAVDTLRKATWMVGQSQISGRPSNWVAQNIDDIMPKPGTPLQSKTRALEKAQSTRNLLRSWDNNLDSILAQPGLTRTRRAEAMRGKIQVSGLLQDWDTLVSSLEQTASQPSTLGRTTRGIWSGGQERAGQLRTEMGADLDPLSQARDAIARGAPRDAVIQRLQQMGISPEGL